MLPPLLLLPAAQPASARRPAAPVTPRAPSAPAAAPEVSVAFWKWGSEKNWWWRRLVIPIILDVEYFDISVCLCVCVFVCLFVCIFHPPSAVLAGLLLYRDKDLAIFLSLVDGEL